MAVSADDVRRVAELARLELSDDEVDSLARDLNGILGHVDALSAIEAGSTDNAGTDAAAPGVGSPLRPDEPGGVELFGRLDSLAPDFRDGFFVVPRLASHRGGDQGPDAG